MGGANFPQEMKKPALSLTRKDFEIRWFSGTGPGGQHRNKTQNCVEITHKESGLSARGTSSRSRITNQKQAFAVLATRLRPWLKEKLGVEDPSRGYCQEVVRNYHAARNEVKDHASGETRRYDDVVDGKAMGDLIEARRLKIAWSND